MEYVLKKNPSYGHFPSHTTDMATYTQALLLKDMGILLYLLGCLSTHVSHTSPLLTRTCIHGLGSTRA